jgi:hypothetical protein
MQCAKCGKASFDDGFMSIIWKDVKDEKGNAKYENYCFDCGVMIIKRELKGVPFTIELPYYPEYSPEELQRSGAALNYIAELVDYPPHK